MDLLIPKRTAVMDNPGYGVCLWKRADGNYIQDSEQNYLCAYGTPKDKTIEEKMRRAAANLGVTTGGPFWLPGFRKISTGEWEDEMADLLDGHTPDPVDLARQAGVI